jgi:hypothetical protein
VKINWNHKPGPVDRLFSTNACSVETEDFLAAGILRKKDKSGNQLRRLGR